MINYPLEFVKQTTPSGYFINMSFNNKIDFKWNVNTYVQVCYVLDSILNFYLYRKGIRDTVDSFSKFGYITLDDGSNLCLPEQLITEDLSPMILVEYFNEQGSYYTSYIDFSEIIKEQESQTSVKPYVEFYNSLNEQDQKLFNENLDKQTIDLAFEFLEETAKELVKVEPTATYNASLTWSTRDYN